MERVGPVCESTFKNAYDLDRCWKRFAALARNGTLMSEQLVASAGLDTDDTESTVAMRECVEWWKIWFIRW